MNDSFLFPFAEVINIRDLFPNEKLALEEFNQLEALKCDSHALSRILNNNVDTNILNYNSIRCNYSDFEAFGSLMESNAFSLFFLNVNSLSKHFDSILSQFVPDVHPPKIFAFCETKINSDIEKLYSIPGYSAVFNSKSTRSGGLALYIKSDINFEIIEEYNYMHDYMESLCIKVKLNGDDIFLCLLYRRPGSDHKNFFELYEKLINKLKNRKCIFFGDTNLDLLKYESCNNIQNFVNLNYENHFFPLINRPTRVSKHSATVIDQIWCNFLENTQFENTIILSDISDHFGILMRTFNNTDRTESKNDFTFRDYRKLYDGGFHDAFQNKLENVEFDNIPNIDNALKQLIDLINNVMDEVCPVKTFKSKNKSNPWITDEIKQLIKEKNKLFSKFCRKPITFGPQYRTCRNRLNNLIFATKRTYIHRKLNQVINDSKKTWSILNDILGRSSVDKFNLHKIDDGSGTTTDRKKIANILNNHFVNTPINLANSLRNQPRPNFREYLNGNHPSTFFLRPLTPNVTAKIVSDLKNTSSGGHLDIPSKVVKCIGDIISTPLSTIFNRCITTGYFPNILKVAQVTPVFKSGNANVANNYRPISVLSIFSKILESHIYNELLSYLDYNDILCHQQCGFRKGISTNIAIGKLINKIYSGIEESKYGIGMFLDLQKAFDMVDREILLAKLNHYGIRDEPFRLIRSFLSNRNQYVKLGNYHSSTSEIRLGTPQGSILSPLLFLIFINDIVRCSNILHFNLFADDTCVYLKDDNINSLYRTLNNELIKVGTWISANALSLNVSKTVYLLFSGGKKIENIPTLYLVGEPVVRQTHTKFLGLIIDEKLSWSNHVNNVLGRTSRMAGILNKIKKLLTRQALKTIYYSLVYPYFQYGIIFWGSTNKETFNRLFRSQKKIIRSVTNSSFSASTNTLFSNLSVLKLEDVKKLEMAKFIHIDMNSHDNFNFHTRASIHSHNTRNNTALNFPRPRTNLYRYSVFYEGIKIYNSLIPEIRESSSISAFKIRFKKFLIALYNISD